MGARMPVAAVNTITEKKKKTVPDCVAPRCVRAASIPKIGYKTSSATNASIATIKTVIVVRNFMEPVLNHPGRGTFFNGLLKCSLEIRSH